MKQTNMACISSNSFEGECSFLAANLYTRSIFGEDALANLSIQTSAAGITGSVRIRCRTQGIAISMGEKINQACL
jgi:coatomer subunit beta